MSQATRTKKPKNRFENKITHRLFMTTAIAFALTTGCNAGPGKSQNISGDISQNGEHPIDENKPFNETIIADFDEPWAMDFIPQSPYALISEKKGKLLLWRADDEILEIANVPKVDYGAQGGFGDVIVSPDYIETGNIYLSWVEGAGDGTRGAVVAKAKLRLEGEGAPALDDINIIWKQFPKVEGRGHFSHRIIFSPDGKYMFIGSGERQKFDPAQDMSSNLGKILRLNLDGTIPSDNPYAAKGGVTAQIWSLGHRNILGMAFDANGQLWNQEMGPAGGDELNLVKKSANYGYPLVSNGNHYDGKDIPDHKAGDGFEAPKLWWNPAISPAGLSYYDADLFPQWKNSLFIGGLGANSLVRVKIDGDKATKAEQWNMNARIREVQTGPDGALWILEDGGNRGEGRLIRLTPKN